MKKLYVIFLTVVFILLMNITFAQNANLTLEDGPLMVSPHIGNINISLSDGRVIVFGGRDYNFVSSSKAEEYNVTTNSFTQLGMNFPHDNSYVIRMKNGKYLIPGGSDNLGVAPGYSSSEIYNPADNSFTQITSMTYGRMMCTGIALNDGRVLVQGGWYDAGSATYGDVFDTTGNTFTTTNALNTPRSYPVVLPANDGGAVVIGGYGIYGTPNFEQVEKFDTLGLAYSILSETLLTGETGWVTNAMFYNTDFESLKMNDGKYLLLFSKADGDSSLYALVTFDPQTKAFAKIPLVGSLKMKDKGLFALVLDKANNFAYLPGYSSVNAGEMLLYAVNLTTGLVYSDGLRANITSGDFLSATSFSLLNNGKILMTGISSQGGTFFAATNKTYLLNAALISGISELSQQKIKIFPDPAIDNITVVNPSNKAMNAYVYDLNGLLIAQQALSNKETKINVSGFSKGMYVLKLVSSETVINKCFIKQ